MCESGKAAKMNTNPMNFNDYQEDPKLDALLDEALSAEGIELPAGLITAAVASHRTANE